MLCDRPKHKNHRRGETAVRPGSSKRPITITIVHEPPKKSQQG